MPQKKKTTKEHLEKSSGEGNVDIVLEKDGDSSTRQSGVETSGTWPMLHWERPGISEVSQVVQH